MKNIFLITSAMTSIVLILFINMGMDSMDKAQKDAMEPVNEWAEEIAEQNDFGMAEDDKGSFSERLTELSSKQLSVTSDLAKGFTAGSDGKPGANALESGTTITDPVALDRLNNLNRRQAEIIDEFTQLHFELTEQLQGIADHRHIQVLNDMNESGAITHLNGIKKKMFHNKLFAAAESAKTWSEKMAEWAAGLESMGTDQ